MTITQNLQKLHATAASLQAFSPTHGYSHVPRSPGDQNRAVDTVRHSKGTRSPFDNGVLENTAHGNDWYEEDQELVQQNDLARSFNLGLRHADDYMDANPLSGEPGSLVFVSTQTQLHAGKASKVQTLQKLTIESKSNNVSAAPSPSASHQVDQTRKLSRLEKDKTPIVGFQSSKMKRRKSKSLGLPDGES